MTVAIDISLEAEGWSALPDLAILVQRSVDAAAAAAGFDPAVAAELSVLLCDDAAIRDLNRTWRGKDKATNVLSFPAADATPPGAPRLMGDIAIALETTRREAIEEGKSLPDHLRHLLVHGTLHLLGRDHEDAADATAMEALERHVLASLGVADPYAGSEPEGVATR